MPVKVGPALFEDHTTIELIPHRWTDTLIFPVRHDRALPPWGYAEVVKTVLPVLRNSREGASLWVPVFAPGKWYFDEMKYALRNTSISVAVTQGRTVPGILDFSKPPGIYNAPVVRPEPAEPPSVTNLSENALRSLLLMSRLTSAYTSEIECYLMLSKHKSRSALRTLAEHGYLEYHPNDGNIDAHLARFNRKTAKKNRQGMMFNGEYWPYWKIRQPGISAALRAWGVPPRSRFHYRVERTRLLNSPHRRRSRQWPKWISKALPHAEIYAGWNEVSISGLNARPDALAWGKLQHVETLFWLEVESGDTSRKRLIEKTAVRWTKAKAYAEVAGLHLVFVMLSTPWAREAVREVFMDMPGNCAVVTSSWQRRNFGKLPFPKWGEAVVE